MTAIAMGSKCGNLFVMVAIVSLCLILIPSHVSVEGSRNTPSKEEDMELEAQLKILNKPPVKTIHTEVGDIFDCIDIYKQPALDHPLLRNHKIQMKPSLISKEVREQTFWTNKQKTLSYRTPVDGCPKGTVPIRRTRKEDLIRVKTLSLKATHAGPEANGPTEYVAGLQYYGNGEKVYGATANIDVYNPRVAHDQFSSAEIVLSSVPDDKYNGIHFGWTVDPHLYGDNSTRSFTYWTADGGYTTGCYNTLCPGFVQVHPTITPSASMPHISVVGGQQYVMQDTVEQDNTGHWWLICDGNIKVGYWPKELFPLMKDGAEYIHWQGHVITGADGTGPQMGSGEMPNDDFSRACFFSKLQYASESREYLDPNKDLMSGWLGCSKGYGFHYYEYVEEMESNVFLFGGPGGTCA